MQTITISIKHLCQIRDFLAVARSCVAPGMPEFDEPWQRAAVLCDVLLELNGVNQPTQDSYVYKDGR